MVEIMKTNMKIPDFIVEQNKSRSEAGLVALKK